MSRTPNDTNCNEWPRVLQAIKDDIAAKQSELERLRDIEAYLMNRLRQLRSASPSETGPTGPKTQTPTAHYVGQSQLELAKSVLVEARRPLHIDQIVDAMIAKGYETSTPRKTVRGSVYAALFRSKKDVRKVGRGKFALIAWGHDTEEG